MPFYRDSTDSRNAGVTYHLVPVPVWDAQNNCREYVPEPFDVDGFIHCTNGLDQLITVANMFYKNDPRTFLVLALDVTAIKAPVRYDDSEHLFPHIYGPLNTDAVLDQRSARRLDDGTFTPFDH